MSSRSQKHNFHRPERRAGPSGAQARRSAIHRLRRVHHTSVRAIWDQVQRKHSKSPPVNANSSRVFNEHHSRGLIQKRIHCRFLEKSNGLCMETRTHQRFTPSASRLADCQPASAVRLALHPSIAPGRNGYLAGLEGVVIGAHLISRTGIQTALLPGDKTPTNRLDTKRRHGLVPGGNHSRGCDVRRNSC